MDITQVLVEKYDGATWSLADEDYNQLLWDETNTIPKPSIEELEEKWREVQADRPMKLLRTERNKILLQTDKYTIPDWPHPTPEAKQAWLDYRQALRDLPANTTDPENPVWPQAPN